MEHLSSGKNQNERHFLKSKLNLKEAVKNKPPGPTTLTWLLWPILGSRKQNLKKLWSGFLARI